MLLRDRDESCFFFQYKQGFVCHDVAVLWREDAAENFFPVSVRFLKILFMLKARCWN